MSSCKNTKYLFSLFYVHAHFTQTFPKKLRHFLCITVSKYKTRSFVNNFKQNILKLYTSVKCKCDWCDSNVFLLNLSNVKYINRFGANFTKRNVHKPNTWELLGSNKRARKILDVANLECLGLENVNIHKYSLGMTNIHRQFRNPVAELKCENGKKGETGAKKMPNSSSKPIGWVQSKQDLMSQKHRNTCLTIFSEPKGLLDC